MSMVLGAFAAANGYADTFGPSSQLVLNFTMAKPNSDDVIRFIDNDTPSTTGSPVFTISIYDGPTPLGSTTWAPAPGATLSVNFTGATSLWQGGTTIPFTTINQATIAGRVVVTVSGGSVTNFNADHVFLYDGKAGGPNFSTFMGDSNLVVTSSALGSPTASLPHFVYGGGFVMGFYVLNSGDQAGSFTMDFFDDNGNPVALPFTTLGPLTSLTDNVPARALKYYEAGTYNGPLVEGSVAVAASSTVTVQALMRRQGSDGSYYEAAVEPAAGYKEFRIPFDTTIFSTTGAQTYTGFAIANLDPVNAAAVTCTARDSSGNTVANAVSVPALNPLGHWASASFPLLIGLRGTMDCTSTTMVGAVAIRAIGTNAISTLPVIH